MRKFINGWLANYALVLICISVINLIVNRNWDNVSFYIELFTVTLMIRLLQLLTNKFVSNYPILEYLLEFGMVIAVVLVGGWLFAWYNIKGMLFVLLTIAVVYVIAYVLDLTRASRDIAYINEQIKQKRIKKDDPNADNI